MNVHKFKTTINYRDDYNGRPAAYVYPQYILLRTHPFYCWKPNQYGRCYCYNIISRKNDHFVDVDIYTYDSISIMDFIEQNMYLLMNNISTCHDGIMLDVNNQEKIIIMKSEDNFKILVHNLYNATMPLEICGFIRYKNDTFLIKHLINNPIKNVTHWTDENNPAIQNTFEFLMGSCPKPHPINITTDDNNEHNIVVDWEYQITSYARSNDYGPDNYGYELHYINKSMEKKVTKLIKKEDKNRYDYSLIFKNKLVIGYVLSDPETCKINIIFID